MVVLQPAFDGTPKVTYWPRAQFARLSGARLPVAFDASRPGWVLRWPGWFEPDPLHAVRSGNRRCEFGVAGSCALTFSLRSTISLWGFSRLALSGHTGVSPPRAPPSNDRCAYDPLIARECDMSRKVLLATSVLCAFALLLSGRRPPRSPARRPGGPARPGVL